MIEIPMPYSLAKLEQLFFLSLSNINTFFSIVKTVLFHFTATLLRSAIASPTQNAATSH